MVDDLGTYLVYGYLNNVYFFQLFSLHESGTHGPAAEVVGVFILPLVPGVGVGAHSRYSGSV